LTRIDFGIRVPVSGPLATLENIRLATKEAEDLGFDAIWVHDQLIWSHEQNSHHISSGSVEAVMPGKDPDFFESLTTLSYLAGITSRVKLGIAVLVLPLRNPVVAAKQLQNIDVLSRGRLILGIGAGAPLVGKTFEAVGVPFDARGDIADDYLKALIAIFHEPVSTYSGIYAKFSAVEVYPKALQKPHPPIIIGGLGRSISRAALYGDGWIPANIEPSDVLDGLAKIRSIAAKQGRKIGEFIVGNEIFASIDKDATVAKRNAAKTIASYARSIKRGGESVTLLGSPSDIVKKTEEYVKSGVNHFELKFIYKDMNSLKTQLRLFQSEVVPSFN